MPLHRGMEFACQNCLEPFAWRRWLPVLQDVEAAPAICRVKWSLPKERATATSRRMALKPGSRPFSDKGRDPGTACRHLPRKLRGARRSTSAELGAGCGRSWSTKRWECGLEIARREGPRQADRGAWFEFLTPDACLKRHWCLFGWRRDWGAGLLLRGQKRARFQAIQPMGTAGFEPATSRV